MLISEGQMTSIIKFLIYRKTFMKEKERERERESEREEKMFLFLVKDT
jgi:hypothetical protein